jgi:hypothetical protein
VLSSPIERQAYDIENRINEGVNLDSHTFEDSTSKKNYFQPRTQTDFYHTKWTDYKKPDWYHPLNGLDGRSEYLYRKTVNSWIPPVVEIAILKVEGYRLYLYMLLFGLWNLYEAYRAYNRNYSQGMEMEILQKSFDMENGLTSLVVNLGLGDEDGDDQIEIVFSESQQKFLQLALEDYIKERQSEYETKFDAALNQNVSEQS